MDGARDAVLQLEVHLGNRVFGEDGGIRDITCAREKQRLANGPSLTEQSMMEMEMELNVIRMAADSTMLRMVKRLMALSLGVHREQLEHRMGLTWPRPFLLRPLFFLFLTIVAVCLETLQTGSQEELGDGLGIQMGILTFSFPLGGADFRTR
jgi:hypothetical protein